MASPASFLDKIMAAASQLLRVPVRSSHAAKLEHALALLVGYLAVRKIVDIGPRELASMAVANAMRLARQLPGVSGAVAKEQAEILDKIKEMVLGEHKDPEPNRALPEQGVPATELIAKVKEMRSKENKFHEGRGMGGIYHVDGDELARVQLEAFKLYNCSNALYPGIFPAVRKFEAEVVRMVLTMVHGDENTCGTMTSGGTESVLLAVLAYREWARTKGISNPEIIACDNAHAALDKAAHYFGVRVRKVPHDKDMRLSVSHARGLINGNTVAIYASAPSFPHGTVDDIEALGELAQSYGIGLHVDNCLGGFLLSYMVKEGFSDRKFDFLIPGVTSMSLDVHKYGLSCKGASCVLYRNAELRHGQYTAVANFSGGLYATPTMQGSRSGAIMATAWVTLMYEGDNGYRKYARDMGGVHARLKKEIPTIPGLHLMGNPDACVVAFSSKDFNIYVLADELSKRGWEVPRLQRPACIHFCVGGAALQRYADDPSKTVVDKYLEDLREVAAECMATRNDSGKEKEGMAGIYGMAGALPDRTVVTDLLRAYMDVLYVVE